LRPPGAAVLAAHLGLMAVSVEDVLAGLERA
jgi:hypothetical protein